MNLRSALKTQYYAALEMLRQAIERCPDDLWTADGHPSQYWQIAYHALFFTHLYLQPDDKAFRPWEHHREEYQFLENVPWPPHNPPKLGQPYSKAQIMEYWKLCDAMIDAGVEVLDLDSPSCGFWWYGNMPKLDHQLMNIRHIQHHAGQLDDRYRVSHPELDWVGTKAPAAKEGGREAPALPARKAETVMSRIVTQPAPLAGAATVMGSPLRKYRAKWPAVIGSILLVLCAADVVIRLITWSMYLGSGRLPCSQVIGAALAAIPIAAGLLLIRRQPAGWTLFKVAAWLNIPLMPAGIVLLVVAQYNYGRPLGAYGDILIGYNVLCWLFFIFAAWWMAGRRRRRDLNGW